MPMNIEMFRKIQTLILEEPTRINMRAWVEESTKNKCNTEGCIAGWAVMLDHIENPITKITPQEIQDARLRNQMLIACGEFDYEDEAARILNISPRTASSLFYEGWPSKFWSQTEEDRIPGTIEYAKRVCGVIDYLIEKFPEGITRENEWEWLYSKR